MLDLELRNKVALVTGASSGMGRSTAVKLGAEGASVAMVARHAGPLAAAAEEVRAAGGKALEIVADVTSADDRRRMVERTVGTFGRLDILINSAGVLEGGSIETTTLEMWSRAMAINVDAVFDLMRLSTPHLIAVKGNVVNISSVCGLRPFPGIVAYGVSKAAVDQLTRCAALDLAPKGVRVNAVDPGVVVTNLHKAGGMDEEAYAGFLERGKTTHPIGRVGQPDEVADLILYLASERAGWITGVTYSIDGGRALTTAR